MRSYAQGTYVSVERSKEEINRTLTRFEATGVRWGIINNQHPAVQFTIQNRRIQMTLPMPPKTMQEDDRRLEVMRRWRSFLLLIKATLEAVHTGLRTVDQAFLSDLLTPSGQTVGQVMAPQLPQLTAGKR